MNWRETEDKHLLLFECCRITTGHTRSLLADYQRNRMEFLPNEVAAILTGDVRQLSIAALAAKYPADWENLCEYLDYLLEQEYLFVCDADEVDAFPPLRLHWDVPAVISNCLLDIGAEPLPLEQYQRVFKELIALGCSAIQIRNYDGIALDVLRQLLRYLAQSTMNSVYLLIPYEPGCTPELYASFLASELLVTEMVVHRSPFLENVETDSDQRLCFTTESITGAHHCGIVSPAYFNFDWNHYLESIAHNTCLNRKIGIDAEGTIKNCPSLQTGYGNIRDTSLADVVAKDAFSRVWNVSKTAIDGCKVCEFRNVCTDCRAYLGQDGALAKPAKCHYNPFTGESQDAALALQHQDTATAQLTSIGAA